MQSAELKQTVLDFDQALDKRRLANLTLDEASALLVRIDAFHERVADLEESAQSRELKTIIAAGCRLTADLSENVMMRVIDILQDKQHSIDFLNQELRHKLRAQHKGNQLVQKAQKLRTLNNRIGEAVGLGLIL